MRRVYRFRHRGSSTIEGRAFSFLQNDPLIFVPPSQLQINKSQGLEETDFFVYKVFPSSLESLFLQESLSTHISFLYLGFG